ncbi:MAG: sulfite exporter TauE/SafE family protein [Haloarculaceae archaeon]
MPAVAASSPDGVGLIVFALVGLLGGAHCLGMCGPLVTTYADRMAVGRPDRTDWPVLRQHLLFNLGRTVSYAFIGALFGAVGMVLFDAADVLALARHVRGVTGVVVGAVILATGLGYLFRGRGGPETIPGLGGLFGTVAARLTARVDRWVQGPRIVGLGMIHGLLPCPILYPAFLYALARGSPVWGFLSLAVLGLGTVPTLFAYGTVVGAVGPGLRTRLHRVLGAVFLVLGYLPLAMGLRSLGVPAPMLPVPFYQPLG